MGIVDKTELARQEEEGERVRGGREGAKRGKRRTCRRERLVKDGIADF